MAGSFDKYDQELLELRQLVARKHEHYPEWSTEQCVHAAIDELYDPELEPNPQFRAVLVARLRDGGDKKRGKRTGEDSP